MHWIDWTIVAAFCAISVAIGLAFRRLANQNLEAYFVSNRTLGWWLAGTSIAATAFSSDTPLLITGMVRRRGIWGVWEVWALGISTMLAVFVFARLWKRANVMTEVEFVERRYHGGAAAFLRGFKAVYWGVFYNCYVMGVWPIAGMTKVLQETTGLQRYEAIVASVALGALYTSMAGLWGVIVTDAFQFVWAMIGAVILAVASVHAVGGLAALSERLQGTSWLNVLPPATAPGEAWLSAPWGWFAGLFLVQWWAWKNADGGGVVVQRLVSCKNERQAMLSVLWFNIAHYCLRSWPWILTALASILLIPDAALRSGAFVDHERAYPRLITMLLPIGLRGVLVASFFAAFLSTLSTQLNWGASYVVNDGYKRFVNRRASERHYLMVARGVPFALALGAMLVAFFNQSIGASFTWILHLTAGIGPVLVLRWCWWRVNPWSEIAAMAASLPMLLLRPWVFGAFGWPAGVLPELLFMVIGTALVWVPATLLTAPVDRVTLQQFYAAVQPPGRWPRWIGAPRAEHAWASTLAQWLLATVALLATTIGPLQVMVGTARSGWMSCGIALACWGIVVWRAMRPRGAASADGEDGPPDGSPKSTPRRAPSSAPTSGGG
ncbi:MAG: Na+:solute symporter [Candidatus Omnitrophica bacterium]|nr:Na+:solute symporter [Candidatus Omnitrophota bacterium]